MSKPSTSRKQVILMAAAVAGGLAGGLFSAEIAHAASTVWSDYVIPAYFELMLSGIPFCA